jgi:glycine oxidase
LNEQFLKNWAFRRKVYSLGRFAGLPAWPSDLVARVLNKFFRPRIPQQFLRDPLPQSKRVLWGDEIYLVPRNDGRILAGATLEYKGFDKTLTAGGQRKLFSAAIELVPALEGARVEETWAGLRPDSPDHLPILGPTDLRGLIIATGHFRSGVLLAPITAKLVREWITIESVSTDWERFSPLRFASAQKQSVSTAR